MQWEWQTGLLWRGREQVALPTWSGSRDEEKEGQLLHWLTSEKRFWAGGLWCLGPLGMESGWLELQRIGGSDLNDLFPGAPQAAWRVMGYLKRPKLFSTLGSVFPLLWTAKSFAAPGNIHLLLLLSPPLHFISFVLNGTVKCASLEIGVSWVRSLYARLGLIAGIW